MKKSEEKKYRKVVVVSLLLLGCILLHTGIPAQVKVKGFDKLTYHADRQNWSVSAASNGMIYFANSFGLLEFDGTTWQIYQLPNQTILRSVKVLNDSLIYTSGYRELGFWKPDHFGRLQYTSLSKKAEKYFTNNIEFWNIASADDYVYFHSFSNRILAWHSDSIVPVDLPGSVSVMNRVNGKVLAAVRNQGIFEIRGEDAFPLVVDSLFAGKLVQFIIPFKENEVLIGTASQGIFVWDGFSLKQWNQDWTGYFVKNELNRGHTTTDGKIIIGTIIDGIAVFNADGELMMKINAGNGLPNNTVLGIDTDEWQNIWLALDDGAGFIPNIQTKGYSIRKIPGIGAIYAMAAFNGKLYLGTNRGLFEKPLNDENSDFSLVPNTQGQVWDVKIIDNNMWVGHNQGTFLDDGSGIRQVAAVSGGFSVRPDAIHDNQLIQCTYTDLVVYKKHANTYQFDHVIKGFFDLIRYVETDHLGNIWASHMHRGIYKITTDDHRENVLKTVYYGENTFGKDHSIHVFKVENRIVFTTNEEIYTYDDLNDTIVVYRELNEQLGKFSAAHRIIEAPNHHYWFITGNETGLFSIQAGEAKLVREYPFSLFKNPSLVDRFENIIPITDTTAYLCMQNGYAELNATALDTGWSLANCKPVLRQFELYSSRDKHHSLAPGEAFVKIKHRFNNVYLRFSFPMITGQDVSYRYFLEGLNTGWSRSSGNELRFERLPSGKYRLLVKAVDVWGNESDTHELQFEVLPPWYSSAPAIGGYIFVLILVLLGFRRWGIRQTLRKEQHEREKREKELIQLRNAKLRDEIEHKSKELASSTMSIIRKNEFLLDLKNTIDHQKKELGTRYPDKYYNHLIRKIEDNISNQDDWQIFENNFERAHEQFFTKIKAAYPDLTPSDLRLCAYLRMNLSSKEIAPLLGISVRGVENHRYRLRKKMNLDHDDSLADVITQI